MATDKNIQNFIINKLTKEQYDSIDSPSPDELYLIPDEIDDTPTQGSNNPVKSGGVFTALSGKQDTIDAQHKLDYSLIANTPTIPTEVFPVTYGTTTQSEILTAVAAGQLPVCKYGDNLYVYAGESSADYSQFTSVLYNTSYRIYVKNSTWGNGSYEIYSKPSGGIPASDIASGVIPAAPVNADWNASSGLAQILNKPSIPAAQVNADWDAVSGVAQILNKPTIPSPKIYIGTCTTAAATAAKEATVETFPLDANNKPLVGTVVGIKFSNTNSAESATLNVNSTGAASIWYDAAAYTGSGAYAGAASRYLYFVWDGTYWAFLSWGYDKDADTNTVGYNLRINGLALPFKSKTYRYRLMFASPDNKTLVPANTSTSTSSTASKTVNQDKINPFGIIWYYSYTSAINAGSTTTTARLWYQYGGIVLGYSFNRTGDALEMTAKDPIYLKCAPQTDGSAIMDSTAPIVHALPSAADGKIYILLGYAESETAMTLIANHPVYYHDGTRIRLWTDAASSASPGTLDTTATTAQTTSASEALSGNVVLHKVSKTGSYDDLLNKPTIPTDVVKYTSQSLTDVQKTQARTNIGAAAASALSALETAIAAKYSKPSGGIPETDLASGVQSALALARTSIQSLADYYSKTEVDALLAAVGSEQYVDVTTLPTASASTLGKIYLVGPDANGFYDRYYTSYDGSAYSWVAVGNTEINLANYATKAEVGELEHKLHYNDVQVGDFALGYYSTYANTIPASRSTSSTTYSAIIPVSAGITYKIYGEGLGNNYYRLYAFYDSNGSLLERFTGSGNYRTTPCEVTAPVNATQMVVNLGNYNSATDKVLQPGGEINIPALADTVTGLSSDIEILAKQDQHNEIVRMLADKYSSVLCDWMQLVHAGAGMNSVDVLDIVSSTSTTITLSSADAAHFTNPGPAVVEFSNGTYKNVYFKAYSGTTVERDDFDTTDLTNATRVQNLHDTARGGYGVHLSAFGYLALGQFSATEIQRQESLKDSNLIAGVQFLNATKSGNDIIVDNIKVATVMDNVGNTGATGGGMTNTSDIKENGNMASSYGFLNKAYSIICSGTSKFVDFSFDTHGEGFVEIQAALRSVTGYTTGFANIAVYADGVLLDTESLKYIQDRYIFDNVKCVRNLTVRVFPASSSDICVVVYSINFYRIDASVKAVSLSGKRIAVLGDSWTQFPGAAASVPDLISFNQTVTRPDGTTGDGYGYFPKMLAQASGATVDNWGKSNMRADDWGLVKIDDILAYADYDYVLIEFFINDYISGQTVAQWARNMSKIIQKCKSAGARPIVVVPCMTNGAAYEPYGIRHEAMVRGAGLLP